MFLFSLHVLPVKYFLKYSYKIPLISSSDQNDSFQNYSYFSGDCIPTLYLDSMHVIYSTWCQNLRRRKKSLHATKNKLLVSKQCQETSGVCLVSHNWVPVSPLRIFPYSFCSYNRSSPLCSTIFPQMCNWWHSHVRSSYVKTCVFGDGDLGKIWW